MLKLYYTGSPVFNTAQTLASKSLGGFISNTTVPNGVSGALFSSLSLMELYHNKKNIQYIGLGLYLFFFDGEVSYDIINLKFNLKKNIENNSNKDFLDDLFNYKIGLSPIGGNNTSGYYLEKIQTGAKPYYLLQDFKPLCFDEETKFNNIQLKESGIGIWLSREFNPEAFKAKFGFNSDYWENNDNLPDLEVPLELEITFEGRNFLYGDFSCAFSKDFR